VKSTEARPRFHRLGEADRPAIRLSVDGEPVAALAGDTLMVAILTARDRLRRSEFGAEVRAGFCLMAACQDCWVFTPDGERLRACDTPARDGMTILTEQPSLPWPLRA
jgi:predicted molibdopterin-dependent oxidoreductase YjgC